MLFHNPVKSVIRRATTLPAPKKLS
ncbi:MAG: hypothetical protein ACD_50C00020G0001, partial [uncultured bacterium]